MSVVVLEVSQINVDDDDDTSIDQDRLKANSMDDDHYPRDHWYEEMMQLNWRIQLSNVMYYRNESDEEQNDEIMMNLRCNDTMIYHFSM